MTASLEQEYAITEAQLKRLFEWPGSEEEGRIAAAIRRRKITRCKRGNGRICDFTAGKASGCIWFKARAVRV